MWNEAPDNLDLFERYEEEQEWLERMRKRRAAEWEAAEYGWGEEDEYL